jgi:gamma-glutamylcyclotransferase (GGCT)/AIG2-like uncharacterized protein YtfP
MSDLELPLLVYGTLKRGGRLHNVLARPYGCEQARYRGNATVHGLIYMVKGGGFPALRPSSTGLVHGELFEHIPLPLWRQLDSIEGHPWMYLRTKLKTTDGESVWAYVYQRSIDGCELIESGNFDVRTP